MIGHTGLLEYHPCPIGALCTRVYCPFMHEQVSHNQHPSPSTSTSNRGLVISQEDNNFQGGGYVGYVGSVNSCNASAMPTTSYNQPVYAQESSISNPSYNQQINYQEPRVGAQYAQWHPTNQYGAYHQSMDHLYGHSALQPQVSLYAPEGPAISTPTSTGAATAFTKCRAIFIKCFQCTKDRRTCWEKKFQPRVREQFSPLADAVSSNVLGQKKLLERRNSSLESVKSHLVKKKGSEAGVAEKQNVIKSQKRRVTEQVQEYQKKLDRQTPDLEKVERAEKQAIDDILSTASHVCVPLSSEPVPKKKFPSKSRPAATVRKSVSTEMPPAKAIVPAKEVVRKQISANDGHQSSKHKEDSKFVVETKAAPASALAHRAKQHELLRHSDSSSRESSVEFVSSPNDVTIDLTSDGEMRGNFKMKVKTSGCQLETSKLRVNAAKIKGKPDLLNDNIKAITKIDEKIEKIGRDLLPKETKKTPVWRQETSARDTVKKWNVADSKPKNLPTPSSGALHNPNFDINSLFDDDDRVESSKNSDESSVQDHPRKMHPVALCNNSLKAQ
uniref:Uncharacterized protein n=1 Tax=Ditylenchus dipsaci TaxID=166011 RepID=A0A915DLV2_9BILA